METQTEVAKADKLPIIIFENSYREDQSGFAVGELMTIHNEGGIMNDFNSEQITYIEIDVLDYSRENEQIKVEIPIEDYYSVGFTTGALQKKIITYDNFSAEYGNNKKQFDVINNFLKVKEQYSEQKTKENGVIFTIGVPEFKTYFLITYTDIFKQKYETYYKVKNSGAEIISKSLGEKYFSSELNRFINLDDINENKLLEIIKKEIKEIND